MPVEHHRNHPDVHQPWAQWSEEETLHVAVCYSNPFRWRTRRELANDCRRHLLKAPNVKLYFGELAYGDRPFEITDATDNLDANDAQFRTTCELFHKENILNQVIKRFPPDWKYGAWVDADFHFTRHDWALETIHQLQHYDFVQPFSSYTDLSGKTYSTGHLPLRLNTGFAFNYIQNGYQLPRGFMQGGWKDPNGTQDDDYALGMGIRPRGVGATGGAWAFRRSAFDIVGGLLDECILGHGDWFMTFGLIGEDAPDMHVDGYSDDYRNKILAWQKNAARLKKNIGYVDCFAIHHFHGSKIRRGYSTRDTILTKHQFAPTTDLRRDWQGIYQLTPDKPALRDDIRQYFISRSEDNPELHPTEKPLV